MGRETDQKDQEKIDLLGFFGEFFRAGIRYAVPILLFLTVTGTGIWGIARMRYQPEYEAYASFVVSSGRSAGTSYYDQLSAEQLGKTFPYLLQSGVLKEVVARDLGLARLDSRISASVQEDTNLFTIRVRDRSAKEAYRVLQSVMQQYPAVAEYIIGSNTLTVMDESGIPEQPCNAGEIRQMVEKGLAAAMALVLTGLLVIVQKTKTIRAAEDLRKLTNTRFLGNVPEAKIKKRSGRKEQLLLLTNPRVPQGFWESIRLVRTRTSEQIEGKTCPVCLITSAGAGEGKTTVAVNLALAFARKKYRVVLIDGDWRKPSVCERMGLLPQKNAGMLSVLQKERTLEKALLPWPKAPLWILPAGEQKNSPAQLIQSEAMQQMMQELRQMADLVIVDTPPCGVVSDAVFWERIADGAILVTRQNKTTEREAQKALEILSDAQIPVLGYLLNGVKEGTAGYGYGRYGYSRYGYGKYGYGSYETDVKQEG